MSAERAVQASVVIDRATLTEVVREVLREEIAQLRAAGEGYLSVPKAAELSGYTQDGIRKLILRGRVRNYGRPGAPRVLLSEVLKLEGR